MKNRCLYLDAEHRLTIREMPVPEPVKNQVLIKISANGICGSDLHFYKDGRLGNFVVDRPYIPGHEASGVIVGFGSEAGKFKEGDRVVIEPGVPCGRCSLCKSGRYNLCPDVVFLSAPPIDGTFCDYVAVNEDFVFPIPDKLSQTHAALAEPVAVAVQAVNRAAVRPGESGIIVGSGPIGLLTLQAFKAAGGSRAVCTDMVSQRLDMALKLGADEVFMADQIPDRLLGSGDVVFETAGNDRATEQLFDLARPGGRCIQMGWPQSDRVPLDVAQMMEKELDYRGINRYANAFPAALEWLADGRIDADAVITHSFSFDDAVEAFDWAIGHPAETLKVVVEN